LRPAEEAGAFPQELSCMAIGPEKCRRQMLLLPARKRGILSDFGPSLGRQLDGPRPGRRREQPHLHQMQHGLVADATRQARHQFGMRNRIEVAQ
jgi:hypothetical protein